MVGSHDVVVGSRVVVEPGNDCSLYCGSLSHDHNTCVMSVPVTVIPRVPCVLTSHSISYRGFPNSGAD